MSPSAHPADDADGAAFLALWNGISDPALQSVYETWHACEHAPERVASPGFIEGRRYRAGDAPDYFTLYTMRDEQCVETDRYRDLIDHPTPWSAAMRPHLRAFIRRPCRLVFSIEAGCGPTGHLATMRLAVRNAATWIESMQEAAQRMVDRVDLLSVRVGVVPPDDRLAYPVGGPQPLAARDGETALVLLAEHQDDRALRAGMDALAALDRSIGQSSTPCEIGRYTLQSAIRREKLHAPDGERPMPRNALMKRFSIGDTTP